MKRIKASNILIITVIVLLFGYILFIIIAEYNIVKKYQDKEAEGIDLLTATNAMALPHFSTVVVTGQNSLQIKKDNSYRISVSANNANFLVKNDTLWVQSVAIVGAPDLKNIIAHDKAVVYARVDADYLNILTDNNAMVVFKDSRISYLRASCSDKSKIIMSNTPVQKLSLKLIDKAKAKLLTTIDTLTGYTESNTNLTISQVKYKDIKIDGNLTKVEITHSNSPFKVEIENH